MKIMIHTLFWALLYLQSACQPTTAPLSNISFTYIANAGIMIESGDTKVIIDALHDPYLDYYQHTLPEMAEQMSNGAPPFDGLDALLVTHVHGDHFDARMTDALLRKNKTVQFVAAQQICDSLNTKSDQLHCLDPTRDSTLIQIGEMQIIAFPLQHTYPTRNNWVQNMAFLCRIQGKSLLVLGDALSERANFERIEAMTGGSVDVALFPIWFYLMDDMAWLKNKFVVRQHIAIHVGLEGIARMEQQAQKTFSDIIFFTKPGQTYLFE